MSARGFDRPRFLVAITALVYVFLFAPIAVVVLFSFNGAKSLQVLDGLSLRWYEEFWQDESLRASLFASIEIAAITTVVATALGTGLALGTMRSHTRTARTTALLLLIPLVTPEIVAGVSAFVLFAQLGVALSLTTVILAHITFSISYVTIVVRGRLASIGPELEEAALDLGATPVAGGAAGDAARAVAGGAGRGDDRVRALVRRLRALVLHDGRDAAAAAGADLLRAALRHLADDQRGRDADAAGVARLHLLAVVLPRLLGRRESGLAVLTGSRTMTRRASAGTGDWRSSSRA